MHTTVGRIGVASKWLYTGQITGRRFPSEKLFFSSSLRAERLQG